MQPLKYRLTTLAEVVAKLNSQEKLAFDIETHDFYGPICLAQFRQRDWPETLLVPNPNVFELAQLCRTQPLLIHSANYEIHTIQRNLAKALELKASSWVPDNWTCTLLLSRLALPHNKEHSLDECYISVFRSCVYKAHGIDKKTMQKTDWRKLDESKLTYAALDVHYLFDLYDAIKHKEDDQSYQLDVLATSHISRLQSGGLSINMDKVHELKAANEKTIASYKLPINVNSYQQVRPYIGEQTSDDTALAMFALNGNIRAEQVRAVRKLTKQNSFLNSYIDNQQDGKLFGLYSFITRSGRGNCRDLNLQQLPRAFKSLFEPREGRVRVTSDYSQLELRMACAIANEVKMAALFKSGEDLHTFTATKMEAARQVGKTCNFNLIYGGSANMLQTILMTDADLLMPIEQVRSAKRKWHSLWPNLTAWQERMANVHRKGGTVKTVLGREMSPNLYTDAMNLPVQGSSAEVAKLALHYQVKAIKEAGLEGLVDFSNFVHDDFDWECDNDPDIYIPLARIVGDSMQAAWFEIVQHTAIPDLPMPISVEVGINKGLLAAEKETPIYLYEV